MKAVSIARLSAAVFLGLAIQAGAGEEAGSEGTALFNGKDLTGWSGDARFWRVENGAIIGETTPENAAPSNTFLIWRGASGAEQPADFEFRFSYRIASDWANSGIQLRSQDKGNHQVAGYQADIATEDWITGILYDEGKGRAVMARRGERVTFDREGKRRAERFAAEADLLKHVKMRDWNAYRVVAQGPVIRTYINGQLMHEVTDESPQAVGRGILAFQIHKGPPMKIEFRDIQLKNLETAGAGETPETTPKPQE